MSDQRRSYEQDAAVAFAMHCDLAGLTRQEGLDLAEKVCAEIEAAADDRPFTQSEEKQR